MTMVNAGRAVADVVARGRMPQTLEPATASSAPGGTEWVA